MSEFGVSEIGTVALAGTVVRNPPTGTITAPTGTVTAERVTVGWNYVSPVPRAMARFRIELRSQDGNLLLFDTFELAVSPAPTGYTDAGGGAHTYQVPYLLSDGVTYQVTLTVSDGFDWSPVDSTVFVSQLSTLADVPDLQSVGSVYEIGLNGQGFMLADRPERRVRRRTLLLEPPRFATGDTPFSEAVERYTMIGYSNFVGGAGQRFGDRTRSVDDRFWDSEGVDPFESGELRLLPETVRELAASGTNPLMAVADEQLYVLTGAKEFTAIDEPGDTPVVFSVAAAGTVSSVASDGVFWYATDGANIYRNSTAADPTTAWSTVDVDVIAWCSDRLVGVHDDSGDAVFTTFAPDGTEEVSGGRFTFEDAEITSITAGDGYVWFAVDRGGSSEVRAWQLGGAPESVSFTAFTLPEGEKVTGLGFYLGNVFIRASCGCLAGGQRAILYRAVPNQGVLTAQRITGIAGSGLDQGSGVWGGNDRYALFSWQEMTSDDRSGVGAIDLATGGWAKWLSASEAAADTEVVSIVSWRGRITFSVKTHGVYRQGSDPVPTGWLRTSHTDLGSSLLKVVDDVRVVFEPLGNGAKVETLLSYDSGVSYVSAGEPVDVAGSKLAVYQLGRTSGVVGVELRLTADNNVSPIVNVAQVRVHPLSLRDSVLVLPVNCSDTLAGMNGQTLPESGPGAGMRRIRFLENLVGSRVKLQDVDWPSTRRSTVWEVADVDVAGDGVFEARQQRRTESAVATVTLRRAAS